MEEEKEKAIQDKIEQIHSQIKKVAERAYLDTISRRLQEKDVECIVELIAEISQRLNNLTPNRKDLHHSLGTAVDLDLIKQELEHDAFSAQELFEVVSHFIARIRLCQAPIGESETKEIETEIESLKGKNFLFSEVVPHLFLRLHQRIDRIEKRKTEFLRLLKRNHNQNV